VVAAVICSPQRGVLTLLQYLWKVDPLTETLVARNFFGGAVAWFLLIA
jgi:hypothetical protein